MQSVAFALPMLAGRAEAYRSALASCWVGARGEAHQDACRRAGITREGVWIQSAPSGAVAVVYLEADDVPAALALLATSTEPFDRWFRDHISRVHGLGLEDGFGLSEPVLDFDTDRI
jgi:hypothetical protein